ncbi:unnamed protein product [Rotaria magnacalcarata]|uniref:Uncharacterized protein n=1 Tax=Rotaria magnacalcarata TaxID=392030 RepID=A0A814K6D7_9BILA|nr:unnamed protein product [Rotaria magnacalcarata]CAF1631625.1 unnamed protein product [Rotaria magnacalcarata]CAF2021777.1 unnamed protein product [Rotaria magnacalcarata]CAF2032425.1 unnamed protein product [Rotaria magnacalcarata]CAF2111681.1 unnamed protein product [Rotaria magnacalcarata]
MFKVNSILIFICVEIYFINCYIINNSQRNPWFDFDVEPSDLFMSKLLHMENLFQQDNSPMNPLDESDGRSNHLQKRGRQCLWKVCSWALDKRSPSPNPGNSF